MPIIERIDYTRKVKIDNIYIELEDIRKLSNLIFDIALANSASNTDIKFRINVLFRDNTTLNGHSVEVLSNIKFSKQEEFLRIEIEYNDEAIGKRIYVHFSTKDFTPPADGATLIYKNWLQVDSLDRSWGREVLKKLQDLMSSWRKRNKWLLIFQFQLIVPLILMTAVCVTTMREISSKRYSHASSLPIETKFIVLLVQLVIWSIVLVIIGKIFMKLQSFRAISFTFRKDSISIDKERNQILFTAAVSVIVSIVIYFGLYQYFMWGIKFLT